MLKNYPKTVDDLSGPHYCEVISSLHKQLHPTSYFEIGSLHGNTHCLSRCATVAVDPHFDFRFPELIADIMNKPLSIFVQKPSDDFFEQYDLKNLLGREVDLAFLDGMHRCEFLLRDFLNTEKHCRQNSVIMLHDCLPVEPGITARDPAQKSAIAPHRKDWWTGDVWRTVLLLKRHRKDLVIAALDAQPTGLILISNLDPSSDMLKRNYREMVDHMFNWNLDSIGIPNLFAELQVENTSDFLRNENLTKRFWL